MNLKQKIIAYFEANPDEELTRQDMQAKFGCSIKTLDIHLTTLKKAGFIERPNTYRKVKNEPHAHAGR